MSIEMSINMSTSTDPRTDYIAMVTLGKAILQKENYEKVMKNLESAKAYLENADDTQKEEAKNLLAYSEKVVLYYRCIVEGLFPDPNPPSTTSMHLAGQRALCKVGVKRDRGE